MKKIFFDFETCGLIPALHSPHELSMLYEKDGEVVDSITLEFAPYLNSPIEASALALTNINKDELLKREAHYIAFGKVIAFLDKYINRFNKDDKAILYGYNSSFFDTPIMRRFFDMNNCAYYGAYFNQRSVDVLVLLFEKLLGKTQPPSYKLSEIAKFLGIEAEGFHTAHTDVYVTREIYYKLPLL